MSKDFLKFKKERQEFREGKRLEEEYELESIEFVILEDNYKPTEKEIKEMAIKIKSLKETILLYDKLCSELEDTLMHNKEKGYEY